MAGIENLHRPGLTPACGLRRAKVGFRFPTIPFLYYEYKIRNISIFYSLEFYFSQRAGEGRKSLHRPGLTPAYGLRRAKVVFSAPSIPFCIYHLYKFRELSSFYLQNYFPQRAGEEDVVPFVKYMLRVILAAYRDFESRIALLNTSLSAKDRIKIIISATIGKITKSGILEKQPDIAVSTVEKALKELVEEGFIERHGVGRSTFYVKVSQKISFHAKYI